MTSKNISSLQMLGNYWQVVQWLWYYAI